METLRLPFDCVGDMRELVFLTFMVKQEGDDEDNEPLAVYYTLACLESGYRHLPSHDAQLTRYLFSTLFQYICTYPLDFFSPWITVIESIRRVAPEHMSYDNYAVDNLSFPSIYTVRPRPVAYQTTVVAGRSNLTWLGVPPCTVREIGYDRMIKIATS